MNRGEIWYYQFRKPDKRRPVLVLTRDSIIPYLNEVTVAPITTVIRDIPTEVRVGPSEGLQKESVINLDHLQTVAKAQLKTYVGLLSDAQMEAVLAGILFAFGFK